MQKQDCIDFLRWALPRLRMRWPGFRRVRGQVCKRVDRRMRELGIDTVAAYRAWLDAHPGEWRVLDRLTRITISRFYRDKRVFERLCREVLPGRARAARDEGRCLVDVCSLGCGAGEEPYSVALLWNLRLQPSFPGMRLHVLAADADEHMLERARKACYEGGSLAELPGDLRAAGFVEEEARSCLRPEFRRPVEFLQHDIRDGIPNGPWDIVMCRNLAFTYFDEGLQREIAGRIHDALRPGGCLVTGSHERLPDGHPFEPGVGGRCFHCRGGDG